MLTISVQEPSPRLAAPANPACALLTPAEIESGIGSKVTGLKNGPSGLPNGVELCEGTMPGATIRIRLVPHSKAAALDLAQQELNAPPPMGAHIQMNTYGPISCRSITPPPERAASQGFNTSCSVTKPPKFVVVEVRTKTQGRMVPIDKLLVLAKKLQDRF